MIDEVAPLLDHDGLLLGSSLGGAGHLAAITGQPVVQPYHSVPLPPAAEYVSEHLADLRTDPRVCAAVRDLDARYVYVEARPLHSTYWSFVARSVFGTAPPDDDGLLARAGTAAVFTLDECY